MPKYTSEVDICNDAVSRVGGKFIHSIETPTTYTERLCSHIYEKNRRIVLRSAVWNFARSVRTIAKSTDTLNGYAAAYPLPNDFVRFLGVQNMDLLGSNTDGYLLANGNIYLKYGAPDSINLEYIRDIADVTKYDALFIEAFALRLAYNLQYAMTGKNATSQRLYEEYLEALVSAKMIDGQEQKPIRVERSRWLAKRLRYNTGQYASKERYFED